MAVLPDVNVLLAWGWKHHEFHYECTAWVDAHPDLATCPITELGFLRVSMSPAFRASHSQATETLAALTGRESVQFIPCDVSTALVPEVMRFRDTTDAYLVALADHHSRQLATLDEQLLKRDWARGIAFNPLTTD